MNAERQVLVSNHAAWRYIERFARGRPLGEAHELVIAAIRRASQLPKAIATGMVKEQFASEHGGKIVYWYDGQTNAVFVTERTRQKIYRVLTCFQLVFGPQGRTTSDTRKARRRRKAG